LSYAENFSFVRAALDELFLGADKFTALTFAITSYMHILIHSTRHLTAPASIHFQGFRYNFETPLGIQSGNLIGIL
jgi:hypothetical protein